MSDSNDQAPPVKAAPMPAPEAPVAPEALVAHVAPDVPGAPDAPVAPAAAEPERIVFDRADFVEAPPAANHVECGLCKRAVTREYWQYAGKILCESCRAVVERTVDESRRAGTFGKAFLIGGAVALGCGIGYAVFVGVSNIQFALVTIGIGWAVGRSIQRVTRGFGTRKHQVLAVALTYFASSMGYLPAIWKGILQGAARTEQSADASAKGAEGTRPADRAEPREPTPTAPPETPVTHAEPSASPGVGSIAFLAAVIVGLVLAAPVIEISGGFSGLLGALIIFFGMQTAWRVSKGVEVQITGPHRVGA